MEQMLYQHVVDPVMKFLTRHITKHLGYVVCSTKHVAYMTKRMNDLEEKSVEVKNRMETNNLNNKEVPTSVSGWLNDVETLKTNALNNSSEGIGCLDMKMRYRTGRKACKDTLMIEELIKKNSGFIWTDAPIPTGRVNPKPAPPTISTLSSSPSRGDVFKSRDNPFNNALKLLELDDTKSQVIALCGMGGVGKTTMMEQLKAIAYDKSMFDLIVKVTITENPNMSYIQNDIAVSIRGNDLSEKNVSERGDSLRKTFKTLLEVEKKRILVILDDVWQNIELKHIGITCPFSNGLKLLLTSRNSAICSQIADGVGLNLQLVQVDVLEEAEAEMFFSQVVGISKQNDLDKYRIGCDIVKECGHLPLAIKIIASSLKSQELSAWRTTLLRLKNNVLNDNVQKVIRLSYDHIKEDEDKEIFLLFGLFPEDYDVPIEDLLRYAWGLELLKNVSTLREARDRTYTCVHNLLDANLLINSDRPGCVNMHDLVLDFVLDMVSTESFSWIIKHNDISKQGKNEMSNSCKRISLTCNDISEFPRAFKYPNLSLLQLTNGDTNLVFPENFYEHMEKLEVIAHYSMRYLLLPRSLNYCTNLKALFLDRSKLFSDYSLIGDLVNLEVLSFAECGITKLPSTIGNLRKLKLLDLTSCRNLVIDDGVFQNLVNLEELYMSVSNEKAIDFTDTTIKELEVLSRHLYALEVEFVEKHIQLKNMSFNKLDKFKISMGCFLRREYGSGKYLFENTLKLVTPCSTDILDCKINELFKKTNKLHLQVVDMIHLKDLLILPHDHQHSFCALTDLEVSECAKLKYLFTISMASGLRKLERLKVSSCSVLEALVYNDESEIMNIECEMLINFEKLKFLSLEKLPELVSLFRVKKLVELPKLVKLKIDGLPNFTSIYPDKNNISSLLNNQVKVSNLEKLNIKSMENLKQLWAEEKVIEISMLKRIKVEGCDSLVNLFPTNLIRLLNHLEKLEVRKCGSIREIFNMDVNCVNEVEQVNTRLRSIVVERCDSLVNLFPTNPIRLLNHLEELEVRKCGSIREIFNMDVDCVNEFEQVNTRLRSIVVEGCDSLVNLFPTNPIRLLNHLEELRVAECGSIIEIFNIDVECVHEVEEISTRLKSIDLYNLKKLREVWKIKGGENSSSSFLVICGFKAVERIKVTNCVMFRNIFTPTNTNIKFDMRALVNIGIENYSNRQEDEAQDESREDGDDNISCINVAFPPSLMQSFQYLHKLRMINCRDVEVLFEIESPTTTLISRRRDQLPLTTTTTTNINQNPPPLPLLPNLQRLELTNLQSMSHVWKWNNYLLYHHNQSSFHNLTVIRLYDCKRIKYLFSPPMAKLLSNLKEIDVSKCDGMEEVVSNKRDEEITAAATSTTTFFPHLHSISLTYLDSLKRIDGAKGTSDAMHDQLKEIDVSMCDGMEEVVSNRRDDKDEEITAATSSITFFPHLHFIRLTRLVNLKRIDGAMHDQLKFSQTDAYWSLCQYPREIQLSDCYKLLCVVPTYALGQMQKLEVLCLKFCDSLIEIFETHDINYNGNSDVDCDSGTNTDEENVTTDNTTLAIPRLEYINRLELSNLKNLVVYHCHKLEYVFTFSTLGSLKKLENLSIKDCENMKAIVKKENEEQRKVVVVVFPCLKTLKLSELPILEGFFLGMVDFHWPLLEKVMIKNCPQITVFTLGSSTTPKLKYMHTHLGKHSLECGLNFHVTTQAQSPTSESTSLGLKHLPWSYHNLIEMHLKLNYKDTNIIPTNELQLLRKVERIRVKRYYKAVEVFSPAGLDESQTAVVQVPNLRHLEFIYLPSLKYIGSRSNHLGTVLAFPNLTTMSISRCHSLEHVFTISMLDSFSQLQELCVSECRNLVEVVKETKEPESESTSNSKEIVTLPHLKSLKLDELYSLKGFWLGENEFLLPSLHILEIKGCPEITVFSKGVLSTPALNTINTSAGMYNFKQDLNSFIKNLYENDMMY